MHLARPPRLSSGSGLSTPAELSGARRRHRSRLRGDGAQQRRAKGARGGGDWWCKLRGSGLVCGAAPAHPAMRLLQGRARCPRCSPRLSALAQLAEG